MSKSQHSFYTYSSPYGLFTLCASSQGITALSFNEAHFDGIQSSNELLNRTANELQQYLAGKRMNFSIPIDFNGTEFQQRIVKGVQEIPYGSVLTPKDFATHVGFSQSYRRMGSAMRDISLMPLVPLHRIILPNRSTHLDSLAQAFRNLEARVVG